MNRITKTLTKYNMLLKICIIIHLSRPKPNMNLVDKLIKSKKHLSNHMTMNLNLRTLKVYDHMSINLKGN